MILVRATIAMSPLTQTKKSIMVSIITKIAGRRLSLLFIEEVKKAWCISDKCFNLHSLDGYMEGFLDRVNNIHIIQGLNLK